MKFFTNSFSAKFIVFLLSLFYAVPSTANELVYPGFERDTYQIVLLKHVLSYSDKQPYQVKAFGADLPKGRAFQLLAKNNGIDVMFGGSNIERESKYQAIRFPLLKGLNGWRIPLVHTEQTNLFQQVNSLAEFKQLIPGQFHTWSDTKVLQSNGIYVEKGSDAEGLYGMLHKKRFDYFPRSVLEVYWDHQRHKHLDVAIEQHTLIQYPTAYYFYVRKGNDALARDILDGLEKARIDGSFEQLFTQFYGQQVNEIKKSKRRLFRLANPLLPKETPLDRKELWIDLSENLTLVK